jgi:polyisoprenoid-binding protein YceI
MYLKLLALLALSLSIVSLSQADEIYKTDPEHTFVSFSYRHLNYSVQTSRFDAVSGIVRVNDKNDGGSVEMTINTNSISTGSPTFNHILQSEDFFSSEKFPLATFKSDSIIFNQDDISAIYGELTIKGITKPVRIEVDHFNCSRNLLTLQYMCGANASAKIRRSDFDLGKYTPFVGDEVTLNIVIEASRQ